MNIPLGFEVGSGTHVSIPLGHTIVLGQTQLSGKTTTLQAMTERSGVCAIAFLTKRGEKSFRTAHTIPAYFTESSTMQPYWSFVCSLLESTQEMKLGFRERGWVMQLCRAYEIKRHDTDDESGKRKTLRGSWKEPKSLREVLANAQVAMKYSKGLNEMICLQLVEYLKRVVPEIEDAELSSEIELRPGINVMDLRDLSTNVQALVVRSVVEWVYTKRRKTVVIIPEAWKFLPEGRSTPVSFPVEELIRQGAALQNFVWIDLQDLRGIKKLLLRSIQVWLFGVQREKNEVANTLKSMPTPECKPTPNDMMQLGIGQFIVAYGNELRKVYVWPAGMEETHAQAIALGQEDPKTWKRIERALDEEKTKSVSVEGTQPVVSASEATGAEDPVDDVDDRSMQRESPVVSASEATGAEDPVDDVDDRSMQRESPSTVSVSGGEDEAMWKEKYAEMKALYEVLKANYCALLERLESMDKQSQAAPSANGNHDYDAIYRYIVERAAKENSPVLLGVLVERPELTVNVERKKVQAEGTSLRGALAILISEKYFDGTREFSDVRKDLIRRGFLGSKAPNLQISQALQGLTEMGFLTKEETGYQAVAGMKVNIVEAK